MARLRQQHPQNYNSSSNINSDIESIVRYLNAAELGNNTVAELLKKLFDENGNFDGPIEFRRDTVSGIQYRIGEYTRDDQGWVTLIALEEIRGNSGAQVGIIGAPIFNNRLDVAAINGQTSVDYAFGIEDNVLVYKNGLLLVEGPTRDYQKDALGGTSGTGVITFNAPLTGTDRLVIFAIRDTAVTGYRRVDFTTTGVQSVFPFAQDAGTQIQVYKNGILQREGGTFDYVRSIPTNSITMVSPVALGNTVTIFTVENTSDQAVAGLMLESDYTDLTNGQILLSKVGIPDNGIPQSKVANLVAALSDKAQLYIGATTPLAPTTGLFWLDISQAPAKLKIYDGTQFLLTSPESSLPTFTAANANQIVKVNGTGTGFTYGTVDLSGVVPNTARGAANGVATLDSQGRLPTSQLPIVLSSISLHETVAGAVTNATRVIQRIYKQKLRIDAIALRCSSGTASIRVNVNGVDLGSTFTVSATPNEVALGTVIEVDATAASRSIGYTISAAASLADLEVTLACSLIAG